MAQVPKIVTKQTRFSYWSSLDFNSWHCRVYFKTSSNWTLTFPGIYLRYFWGQKILWSKREVCANLFWFYITLRKFSAGNSEKSHLLLWILFVPYELQWCNPFCFGMSYTSRKSWLKTPGWYVHAVIVCRTSNFKAWYLHQNWCWHLLKPTKSNRHTHRLQRCSNIHADCFVGAWYSSPCGVPHIISCTCIQFNSDAH